MKTIMVTGSTQGLGLQIATQLSKIDDTKVIIVVRNIDKGTQIARKLGKNVRAVHLDLSKLTNITKFVSDWSTKLDGLVNNAGVQFSSDDSYTPDGFEETIAVNHLAAFMLTIGLEKHLSGARVLFIGSATHHPTAAESFGFRGAQYTSIPELAAGKSSSPSAAQRNRDRYATSKFLNMVTAAELTRRNKPYDAFVLDPGLMPGTGLARTQKSVIRQIVWKGVLPILRPILPDTSSTRISAKAAVWILNEPRLPYPSGTTFSFNKQPSKNVWQEKVNDPKIGAEVFEQSLEIINKV